MTWLLTLRAAWAVWWCDRQQHPGGVLALDTSPARARLFLHCLTCGYDSPGITVWGRDGKDFR